MSRSSSLIAFLLLPTLALSCAEPATEPVSEETAANATTGPKDDSLIDDLRSDEVAFADMSNSVSTASLLPVRGRIVEEKLDEIGDPEVTPWSQVSQDEIDDAEAVVTVSIDGAAVEVGTVRANEEGYIDTVLDVSAFELPAGRHDVTVWVDDEIAGGYQALLLAEDHTLPVVRSDVDLTYLNTDFQSRTAMIRLLRADASEREALPAMAEVYQAVRGDDAIGVTFVSGSPRFFKRTLEAKMALDGVALDGLVLKPFKDLIRVNLFDLRFTDIMPALHEQVGFKLAWLLKMRAELPATTPEILMGDDSEADFVVYAIYADVLAGQLDGAELETELTRIGVTADWLPQILESAGGLSAGQTPAPLAIYVNRTGAPSEDFSVSEWSIGGLTRHHRGAWPLILDMYEEGFVAREDVIAVQASLLESGQRASDLDSAIGDAAFLDPATAASF